MSAAVRTPSAKKAINWLSAKIAYSASFGVLVLLGVGLGMLHYASTRGTAMKTVRIAYGSGAQVRRQFLEQLAVHGKARHLNIQLVPTAGTQETISVIEQHGSDLGLITGAIHDDISGHLFEVLPLYMESLQLLVKEPLYEEVAKDFGHLRGKTIGIDSENSATNLVSSELLSFIGLVDHAGVPHYRPVNIPQRELVASTDSATLPDAVFLIGGLPAPAIRKLIDTHNYRLVPLPFGSSFNLEKFRDNAASDPPDATLHLDRAFIEEFVIPAFTYGVLPPVPPVDTRTIASRLLLVGSDEVDQETIRRMLDLILSPEIRDLVRPTLTAALLDSSFQFPRHPGSEAYARALNPVDVESAFVTYGRAVEVWGLIITIYIAAARLLRWLRQRNRGERRSVTDFMVDVIAIEADAHAACSDQDRARLDQRLTDLKKAAIELHVNETLEDAENLPSLLVTLADARTRIWGPSA